MTESDKYGVSCPRCGSVVQVYRNPVPTVDIVIRMPAGGIVLIERSNPPHGWALPGGFVDYGETLESAAVREAMEETGLELEDLRQFRAYSDPSRDPRHHTVTMVFTALGKGMPHASDDARNIGVFFRDGLPEPLAFDHAHILDDYFKWSEK